MDELHSDDEFDCLYSMHDRWRNVTTELNFVKLIFMQPTLTYAKKSCYFLAARTSGNLGFSYSSASLI